MSSIKDAVGSGSPQRLGSISDTETAARRRRLKCCIVAVQELVTVGCFAAVFGIATLPSWLKKADGCMIGSGEQGITDRFKALKRLKRADQALRKLSLTAGSNYQTVGLALSRFLWSVLLRPCPGRRCNFIENTKILLLETTGDKRVDVG